MWGLSSDEDGLNEGSALFASMSTWMVRCANVLIVLLCVDPDEAIKNDVVIRQRKHATRVATLAVAGLPAAQRRERGKAHRLWIPDFVISQLVIAGPLAVHVVVCSHTNVVVVRKA